LKDFVVILVWHLNVHLLSLQGLEAGKMEGMMTWVVDPMEVRLLWELKVTLEEWPHLADQQHLETS